MHEKNYDIDEDASRSGHTFHIPVMGTCFTIDTPLRVARYGISSVISLVDDVLIEQMRKYYCDQEGRPYEEISRSDEDARARRITAYLNLLHDIVSQQVEKLMVQGSFDEESEITRYYEMLPDSPLKRLYTRMLTETDAEEKAKMQEVLRRHAVPGSIDVNIMTKLDFDRYRGGEKLPPEFSDASSALRGYANSVLQSSIVFSAGMNPHLFGYLSEFDDFFPDENGIIKKKIILKVSDYRSAMVQGKYLAKRGLWVSEYRVESGVNCGGHAFVSEGSLMGPILEEFRQKKEELFESLHTIYIEALEKRGKYSINERLKARITAQGGIVSAEENELLLRYYDVDATGWGTPFLLVPEASTVDEAHLQKLIDATDDDVYISDSSPLGVPFWNLRNSASEEKRRERIRCGCPGSACPKGLVATNTEFTKRPICPSSRLYQKRKLEHLAGEGWSEEQLPVVEKGVLRKSCICHDLAGGATLKYGIDKEATPAICCGPSITYFTKLAKLEEMVGHIYGRISLLSDTYRPHMFVKEIMIYVNFLRKEMEKYSLGLSSRTPKYFKTFKENLLKGIEYYHRRAGDFFEKQNERFLLDLKNLQDEIEAWAAEFSLVALPSFP